MKKSAVCFVVFALLTPIQALAWSKTGHRAIAELAEMILKKENPRVLKKAKALLKNMSFADVSNWADEVQDKPKYSKIFLHQFHFLNIPDGYTLQNVPRRPDGDALTALQLAEEKLSKRAKLSKKERAEWLMFYVHLIGDLQQPLHISRPGLDYYEQCNLPKPGPDVPIDRGGNDLKVHFFSDMSNLHRVWDNDLIEGTALSYTELAQELFRAYSALGKRKIRKIAKTSPAIWVAEALVLRKPIYRDLALAPPNDKDGLPKISYAYAKKYTPVIKVRLLFGGIRLAYRLNALLK